MGLWNQVSYDYTVSQGVRPLDSSATPESTPEPTPTYARVWSENGKPVNTRKGPGTYYAQSRAGKLPVGTRVELIGLKNGWCRIRCTDSRNASWICWIKAEFLKTDEETKSAPEDCWSVTIPHLLKTEVEELIRQYPSGTIQMEGI